MRHEPVLNRSLRAPGEKSRYESPFVTIQLVELEHLCILLAGPGGLVDIRAQMIVVPRSKHIQKHQKSYGRT